MIGGGSGVGAKNTWLAPPLPEGDHRADPSEASSGFVGCLNLLGSGFSLPLTEEGAPSLEGEWASSAERPETPPPLIRLERRLPPPLCFPNCCRPSEPPAQCRHRREGRERKTVIVSDREQNLPPPINLVLEIWAWQPPKRKSFAEGRGVTSGAP